MQAANDTLDEVPPAGSSSRLPLFPRRAGPLLYDSSSFPTPIPLLHPKLKLCTSPVLRMASTASPAKAYPIPKADLDSFTAHLQSSTRILALLGAGLSASSGLPTFRGAGGLWRTHDATSLATPWAFDRDPGLVWQFYSYRRHMALKAKPNRAHYALAELARRKQGFVTLSQNVDGIYCSHILRRRNRREEKKNGA